MGNGILAIIRCPRLFTFGVYLLNTVLYSILISQHYSPNSTALVDVLLLNYFPILWLIGASDPIQILTIFYRSSRTNVMSVSSFQSGITSVGFPLFQQLSAVLHSRNAAYLYEPQLKKMKSEGFPQSPSLRTPWHHFYQAKANQILLPRFRAFPIPTILGTVCYMPTHIGISLFSMN